MSPLGSRLLAVVLTLAAPAAAQAQCNGFSASGTLSGIINSYYGGTGTRAAGTLFVTVDTAYGRLPAGSPAIAAGDLLLIVQMQDAQINNTNTECYGDGSDETGGTCTASGSNGSGVSALNGSGLFEYVIALGGVGQGSCGSGSASRICILGAGANNGLLNTYTTAARTAARGQRTYQVIRVPQYASATLSSSLTAYPWDGHLGGILAVDVSGTLALNGATVSVNGLGFRGARGQQMGGVGSGALATDYRTSISTSTTNCNTSRTVFGTKGEGVAGTPRQLPNTFDDNGTISGGSGCDGYPSGERARGAPGNAGGGGNDGNPAANDENAGGGGGGNGGAGGRGGNSYDSNLVIGGFGGAAFPAVLGSPVARLTLGGGGGSGTRNNTPTPANAASGAVGGGIALIRAGALSGSGAITADGLNGVPSDNDGGGGGGAGGSVAVLVASGNQDGLTVTARGGSGGDAWITHDPCVPRLPPGCAPPGERHGPGGGGGGGVVFLTDAPTVAPDVSGGVNGLTTTVLDAFGALPGSPGAVAYGAAPDQTPGVLTCLSVTRASIAGLRVRPGVIEFATGSQRATRGFNVHAQTSGGRTRLNASPLLSPLPDSSAPLLYRLAVGPLRADRLWLEELQSNGGSRWLGPFAPDDVPLRAAYETLERRLDGARSGKAGASRALVHARGPAERPVPSRRTPTVSAPRETANAPGALALEVAGAGVAEVTFADLLAAGLPPELAARPRGLRLFERGQRVAFETTAGGLRFQARRFDSDFSAHGVYVLAWGALRPPPPRVEFTRSGPPLDPGWLRVQQNQLYAPFAPRASDPWIWDVLVHATPAGPYGFDLPGLAASGGEVELRVFVSGASEHTHSVSVELNGTALGSAIFTGRELGALKTRVPRALLLPAGNTLHLGYEAAGGSTPPEQGVVLFDALDLSVSLPVPDTPVDVVRIAPYDPSIELPSDTDYLIVTHPDFMAQAQRLALVQQARGRRAQVLDVERAYDRYAAGQLEAQAVAASLRDARRNTALRDVLLLGDDTFDPRDLLGQGLRTYVPSLDGWDGEFGRVPSENRYADVDGDARPDLAIGRLPAQTVEQAELLVDKIEGQQAMLVQLAGRQLFAVDNSLPGDVSFRGMADRAAGLLPHEATFADIGVDGIAAARARLLAGLAAGQQVTHYFGHGGFEVWADEGLLHASDAAGLAGSGLQTVLLTWACESQWYQYDWGPSINEALLLVPDGGALAALGPTGISAPRLQVALAQGVYERLVQGLPLGEAVRRAKIELLAADPGAGPVVEGWSLLGDPALTLPLPGGSSDMSSEGPTRAASRAR